MQTCPRPLRVSILKPSVSVDFLWMSAEHMWMSPDLWWLSVGLWPPVTVSSHRKIKSSHHSYFPVLTRVFKAALPFPTTVPFRVQVSSWGAALDENSSFQAWFHSGSFWELGKSSKTSKLKTSPHDLPTFSLVRLAGGSVFRYWMLIACQLPHCPSHHGYQLYYQSHLSKFPSNVDMTLRSALSRLALTLNAELGPAWES